MKKVLVCDDVHPSLISGLEAHYLVDYRPEIQQDEVETLLADYHGIVINSKTRLHRAQIECMTQMQWIARLGSGMEIIDTAFAKMRGILTINTPAANANAVAEHALGMLLSLMHKLHIADHSIRQGDWEREAHRGIELMGRTVGIIGYGNNGSRFGHKLSGMGVKVIAHDPYKSSLLTGESQATLVSLSEVQARADIISFHVPLTAETHHYFDRQFHEKCRDDLILINTSRGKVVDQEYLVQALGSGSLRGACLDVFTAENKEALRSETMTHLRESARVILSPHVAGWTQESKERIALSILNQLNQADFLV